MRSSEWTVETDDLNAEDGTLTGNIAGRTIRADGRVPVSRAAKWRDRRTVVV